MTVFNVLETPHLGGWVAQGPNETRRLPSYTGKVSIFPGIDDCHLTLVYFMLLVSSRPYL